jgi:hypothetical protein
MVDAGGLDGVSTSDAGETLRILRPASTTYTNQAVTVEVTVPSGGSSSVQLLRDGSVLAVLTAPTYSFVWDTTQVGEGSYQLVAQTIAGGEIVMSSPVTVIVDRTSPTIVSSVPASGATNVSLTDPWVVVFSESLAPASITAGAIRVAFGTVAANTSASLAADGQTVHVSIADRSSIVLPGAMTETVTSSITDLAGNAIVEKSWSASVPVWVDLGTLDGGYPQLVLDGAGKPIVVNWRSAGGLQIARYAGGTSWDTSVPPPGSVRDPNNYQGGFGIASGNAGDLFLAWCDSSSVHLARWTGTMWERHWSSPAGGKVFNPAVALTKDNRPIVHWQSDPDQGNPFYYQSRVAVWNGSGWDAFPGLPMGPCHSLPCRVIVDSSDRPSVEVTSNLFRWTGTGWVGPAGSSLAALAINDSNQILSVQVKASALQVVALSKEGTLTDYVPQLPVVASSISIDAAPQLAVDGVGQPIVVWLGTGGLRVARWTGAAWDQSYGTLQALRGKAAIAVAQGSIPVLAWQENPTAGGWVTYVAKSNH